MTKTRKKTYKVGEKVRFWMAGTPMTGTVLFAMGTDAVGVRLESGKEICIGLSTIH